MNSLFRLMTILVAVALMISAGCAGESHKKKRHTSPPVTPPPVEEPPVVEPPPVEPPPEEPLPVSETGSLIVKISPDAENPYAEWRRIKITGEKLTEPLFVDALPDATSVSVGTLPTGLVTVEATAWKDIGTLNPEPMVLSYGAVAMSVAPCAEPCSTQTMATVVLAPSSVTVGAPEIIYDSAEPQEVTVTVTYENFPLELAGASFFAGVVNADYPETLTFGEYLCGVEETTADAMVRSCSGMLPPIDGFFPASVKLFVSLDGSSWMQGGTLLSPPNTISVTGIAFYSDPLPGAP